MEYDHLEAMRSLRRRVEQLNQFVLDDYEPFRYALQPLTFVRRPPQALLSDATYVSVTPTCTAIICGCACGVLDQLLDHDPKAKDKATRPHQVLKQLINEKWDTGGLPQNNAFTASLFLRAAALLLQSNSLSPKELSEVIRDVEDIELDAKPIPHEGRKFHWKSPQEICAALAEDYNTLQVQFSAPTTTLGYWLWDAASVLKPSTLSDGLRKVADWATADLRKLLAASISGNDAIIDPIGMAMGACLCRLVRRVSRRELQGGVIDKVLPSDLELVSAVRQFFNYQNEAGVWHKYFPIFHYPKSGPNHCWHFEVLEAVVTEFPELLTEREILSRIEKAVRWLELNRLSFQQGDKTFRGWNAGGDLEALRNGEPESWPTGMAHMFLARLGESLSERIRDAILVKYRDRVQSFPKKLNKEWDRFLDCCLPKLDEKRNSVCKLFESELLEHVEEAITSQRVPNSESQADVPAKLLPSFRLRKRRSALLFGPPGTSKTTLVKAIAMRVGWPFVELSPSDFLKGGLEGIYGQVNEVFEDLMDLYGVVILFDEMDALVQSRDNTVAVAQQAGVGQLDVTQKFLTTSMLPKLLKLRERARCIFFMATNHQREFDVAIKRAGRFDILVRMGPPSYQSKVKSLRPWMKDELDEKLHTAEEFDESVKRATKYFSEATTGLENRLDYFTFGEMHSFFELIRRETGCRKLEEAMKQFQRDPLRDRVHDWAKREIMLREGPALQEYEEDGEAIRLQ